MSEEHPEREEQQRAEEKHVADPATREALDRLNESNRVLLESRMTDSSKPLTKAKIEEIRARFNAYVTERGVRLTTVAKETDYSTAVVSTWASDRYKGNVDKVSRAINDWLDRHEKRIVAQRPRDYVKTWVAEDMRSIVHLADKRGMMAAIVVPAGAGKTYVMKALADELRGLYVYCHDRMSPRDLLRTIASGLGRRGNYGTSAEMHAWIVDAMRGTRRVIFLDEAHRLRKALGFVRSLHDEAGVPIIMAGTVEILEAINDRTDGRGQFSSRTIRYNALDQARNAEDPEGNAAGKDLFTIEEIKRFFDMKKIKLDRDALRFLWLLACLPNFGCLRLIEHVTETVFDFFPDVEVVEREQVVTALKMLYGADAVYVESLTERHVEISRTAKVA
ncbi:MAG: hypothetical protein QOF78_602 [Phycisphaerales bacterium]|jgi:DNA transposition AAA+ family ATPase|nr:hypothetical protein [Phycisphaerales bacterium]